ncbi:amylo-alpha-1,6-glucosidase [Aestuariivivens sediminis]|uniref:amylo-alpha-1,6-glucosidase n=1 Tax=Aestuariivivens sediminis TaxID=2913557 RepID=UPI001F5AD19C|nr:trehalase family glycosidase [Aestuariivivens sediminis]
MQNLKICLGGLVIMSFIVSCSNRTNELQSNLFTGQKTQHIGKGYSPGTLEFNIEEVPFSIKGSYMACSARETKEEKGLYIWDVSGRGEQRGIIKIEPTFKGDVVLSKITGTPEKLAINTKFGNLEISFDGNQALRFFSKNDIGVKLSVKQSYTLPKNDKAFRIIQGDFLRYMFTSISGNANLKTDRISNGIVIEGLPSKDGILDFVIEEYESEWSEHTYSRTFNDAVEKVRDEFSEWMMGTLPVNEAYSHTRTLAAYINWSSIVSPRGFFKRSAMLMSKNWMNRVWSWDHCFNALALANGNPRLAWDQFMIMFDQQHELGAIPDCMTDNYLIRGYLKPPIHGWALKKLMGKGLLTEERLDEIYTPLSKWTDFWMTYRDDDKNGMPQYHHGNDSGWDNGSVFAENRYVEGPELSAYLVIQMDVLSEIAEQLGKKNDKIQWKQRADILLKTMIKKSWIDGQFVSKYSGSEKWNKNSRSLMAFLPLVLGERLPADIREKLVVNLRSDKGFITPYGPATENIYSPYYSKDGYWRGAIWAPTTYLIVDGLASCKETELAKDLANRFVDMCNNNGFGENFDPITGASLRDPAYTWTSSVFLLLANEYAN